MATLQRHVTRHQRSRKNTLMPTARDDQMHPTSVTCLHWLSFLSGGNHNTLYDVKARKDARLLRGGVLQPEDIDPAIPIVRAKYTPKAAPKRDDIIQFLTEQGELGLIDRTDSQLCVLPFRTVLATHAYYIFVREQEKNYPWAQDNLFDRMVAAEQGYAIRGEDSVSESVIDVEWSRDKPKFRYGNRYIGCVDWRTRIPEQPEDPTLSSYMYFSALWCNPRHNLLHIVCREHLPFTNVSAIFVCAPAIPSIG